MNKIKTAEQIEKFICEYFNWDQNDTIDLIYALFSHEKGGSIELIHGYYPFEFFQKFCDFINAEKLDLHTTSRHNLTIGWQI